MFYTCMIMHKQKMFLNKNDAIRSCGDGVPGMIREL